MVPLVIYHSPCIDGFTAAWAIWKKHPDWEFFAGKHGDAPPDVTGRDVYMVDFSYKLPVILEMIGNNLEKINSLTILDHHKTAQEDLERLRPMDPEELVLTIRFDMDKSGARLTWEYFHPDEPVPDIVKYVEDRDLWRFTYKDTEAVNAYIFSQQYDFNTWTVMAIALQDYENGQSIVDMGNAITTKHHKDVKELSVNKYRMSIAGYDVPVVNVPYTLASDMGHLLGKGEPFAATYFYDGKGFVFSLRSEEGGVDVSEIAKKFGGGGHKHAAGFKIVGPLAVSKEIYGF